MYRIYTQVYGESYAIYLGRYIVINSDLRHGGEMLI